MGKESAGFIFPALYNHRDILRPRHSSHFSGCTPMAGSSGNCDFNWRGIGYGILAGPQEYCYFSLNRNNAWLDLLKEF
jgi:hypothetical protein